MVLRIKQTRHLGIQSIRKAVVSVCYHERDHQAATIEERKIYHKNCMKETKCPYYMWVVEDKKDPAEYVYERRDQKGKKIPGGYLADPLFDKYPQAWSDLCKKVEN